MHATCCLFSAWAAALSGPQMAQVLFFCWAQGGPSARCVCRDGGHILTQKTVTLSTCTYSHSAPSSHSPVCRSLCCGAAAWPHRPSWAPRWCRFCRPVLPHQLLTLHLLSSLQTALRAPLPLSSWWVWTFRSIPVLSCWEFRAPFGLTEVPT